MQPIFFEPVLQEKIWGGNKLGIYFDLPIQSQKTGEAWMISAHPNGITKVTSPQQYQGLGLDQVYQEAPELFGNPSAPQFPLLTKLIDASEALSVQVHPDDHYAQTHEGPNELGKTECWYIVSAAPGAKIVYGHKALTRQEFEQMVAQDKWSDLLTEVPVKDGDFFYVPHGTLHAIGAGIVILEIQQSSDTTYRVFDYHRKDDHGNERDLHLRQSADVTMFPHQDPQLSISKTGDQDGQVWHYLSNDYFSVYKWDLKKTLTVDLDKPYYLATVITGEGEMTVDGQVYPLKLADSFILPAGIKQVTLAGDLEIMVANPESGVSHV